MLRTSALPLALCCAALAPASAGAAPDAALFVQSAREATLTPLGGERYRLALDPVDRVVTTFSDRPKRVAGSETARAFVAAWRERGFAADPPNAALVVDEGRRRADTLVVELTRPRLRGSRLVYDARRIEPPATGALAGHGRRADRALRRRLGPVHLFVDDAGAERTVDLTLQMTSPGRVQVTFDSTATLTLGEGDDAVEWAGNAGGGYLTPTTASVTFVAVQGAIGGFAAFAALTDAAALTGTVRYDQGGAGATLQVGDGPAQPLPAGRFSTPLG